MEYLSKIHQWVSVDPIVALEQAVERANNTRAKTGAESITKQNKLKTETYTASQLTSLCRDAGILTQLSGKPLSIAEMMGRLKMVTNSTADNEIFNPSAFGANWKGYWYPYFNSIGYTIFTTSCALIGIFIANVFINLIHSNRNCNSFFHFLQAECYIVKKARQNLEELNYYILYTAFCAISVSALGLMAKIKAFVKNSID